MNNLPIGVFDSGIGGLTVVREIIKILPNESLIYLGDTARVPYGTRDKETINKFAAELVRFLLKQKVKALVVACNTMSAVALLEINKVAGEIPVIDVIGPTVKLTISKSKGNGIGVIGTRATVNSGAYQAQITKHKSHLNVVAKACPLFVPLVEEGLIDHPATKIIAKDYLLVFKKKNVSCLILGCTHYPLLEKIIRGVLGNKIVLVDSAKPTALELKRVLEENNLLSSELKPKYSFYVTDKHPRMAEMVSNIFGNFEFELKKVNIDSM